MARRRFVGGLDVGTTKVCACIGELTADGAVGIIGVGVSASRGVHRGIVVDVDAAGQAVHEAVRAAESMAGVSLDSVCVGISGAHVASLNASGVVALADGRGAVTDEDIQRVLAAARGVKLPPGRELVHVVPQEFVVDGQRGVRDPVGMTGARLEAVVHAVTAASDHIYNLVKAVQQAGLAAAEPVLPSLAAAQAVLEAADRDMGVALVDIGGGTTDVAVFMDGRVVHSAVVPVSAHHVTNDIAVGMQIPLAEAEELKVQYGAALRELSAAREAAAGLRRPAGTRLGLADIVPPRIEELLHLVRAEIQQATGGEGLPGGVVLTGGGALLAGMLEAAQRQLGLPARLGVPHGAGGLAEAVSSPIYSTAVGLMQYAGGQEQPAAPSANGAPWRRLLERVREFLSEVL